MHQSGDFVTGPSVTTFFLSVLHGSRRLTLAIGHARHSFSLESVKLAAARLSVSFEIVQDVSILAGRGDFSLKRRHENGDTGAREGDFGIYPFPFC